MNVMPILETERLLLRRPELSDAADVQDFLQERQIAANTLHIPFPYPDGAAEAWVTRTHNAYNAGEACNFAIVLKNDNRLIGAVALRLDLEHRRAELGYWIGKPYWNKGYASEAAQRLISYGFDVLGLNRIQAMYFADNPASERVMQKIGMRYEGLMREYYLKWGEFRDSGIYAITRRDYESAMTGGWSLKG
jgi:RimJ/RimL family protein N-acetyltransferase